MRVRYDALLLEVARHVGSRFEHGGNIDTMAMVLRDLMVSDWEVLRQLRKQGRETNCSEVMRVYRNKVQDAIQAWDIRCVGTLRRLFPGSFPEGLRTCTLGIEDGDEHWYVYSVEAARRKERMVECGL